MLRFLISEQLFLDLDLPDLLEMRLNKAKGISLVISHADDESMKVIKLWKTSFLNITCPAKQ